MSCPHLCRTALFLRDLAPFFFLLLNLGNWLSCCGTGNCRNCEACQIRPRLSPCPRTSDRPPVFGHRESWEPESRGSQDFDAYPSVPVHRSHDFVFDSEGAHKLLKCSELIKRARELVEEHDVSSFQVRRKCSEHEECGGKHIRVQVENQPAREVVMLDETRKGVLKESDFKGASWIFNVRNCAVGIEVPSWLRRPPPLGKAGKRVESNESRLWVTDQIEPHP